jgi:hypothetical protein
LSGAYLRKKQSELKENSDIGNDDQDNSDINNNNTKTTNL